MNDKARLGLTGGAILLSLGGIYYLSSVVVPKAMVTMTKAAPASKLSLSNSYVLGQKILARADGEDKCIVNIYILDDRSQGVKGKTVTVEGAEGVEPVSVPMTDNNGKASFQMVSTEEKQYELKASVEGVELPKSIKCTFRN